MQHDPIDLRMVSLAVSARSPRVETLGDAEQLAARALRVALRGRRPGHAPARVGRRTAAPACRRVPRARAHPRARALGRKVDPRGRTGEAIAITLRNDGSWPSADAPWPPSVERETIFDPDTSEVLAVSARSLDRPNDSARAAGSTVVEATGQVGDVGERP
jgi:hypothetical protein